MCIERGSHERSIAALVHVRSVHDHPFPNGDSLRAGLPWHTAFGNPRERPIFAVTQWSPVQSRVVRHHRLDTNNVVGVDGLFELPDLFEGLDMNLELRPA